MKSIQTYINEAKELVKVAVMTEEVYCELNESNEEWTLEFGDQVLEASERKNKALKQAIKAVKDLFTLFDLEAPKLRYLFEVQCGLYTITHRWEYMNKNIY